MKVLVDTPICSYAFRSNNKKYHTKTDPLIALIQDQKAILIGPIRQEILSGYSYLRRFSKIRKKLSYLENTAIKDSDYELAAKFSNKCRKKGIQGSHTDFLICAVANRVDVPIFTNDKKFNNHQTVIPTRLYNTSQ